ncbi:MAG TPA: AraC family transcriptional regulator [Lachnospiraceae bacterium]|nr:AraC family transcriptional regulator [Lachnospiraceae bacterium]
MNNYDLKEKAHHGTKEFPIEIYHTSGLIASYHWHEECEFIYITSGSACIRIGVDIIELKEGECAYVKANVLHSISTKDNTNFGFYAVVFHPSLLISDVDICNKYLSSLYVINHHFSPSHHERVIIEELKSLCHTYEDKPFAYELKVKSQLYIIFSHIFEFGLFHIKDRYENKKAADKLEKVIKYIHTKCLSSLTVDELAQVAGYSVSHFTRFFKEITGKTPMEYINRQKIYYACEILKETDHSVLDVSLACGFGHVGHFINTFKKYTDCTPYKFKKTFSLYERDDPSQFPSSHTLDHSN